MVDMNATKEAYENFEIDDIGWIPGTSDNADAFTKWDYISVLADFLNNGIFKQEIFEWIIWQA